MLPAAAENARAVSDTEGSGEGYLYRYRDLVGERAAWVREIITDSRFYFSSPAAFNDPFDCQARFRVDDGLQARVRARARSVIDKVPMPRRERRRITRLKVNPAKLLQDMTKEAREAIQKDIRVLSLSATHENILMWSHYANGHQGICLQFRLEADRGFFAGSQPVVYSAELPVSAMMADDPMEPVDKLLLTKAKDWEYECEWRLIHQDGVSAVMFPPELLTGVILGAKISSAHRELIAEWARARTAPLTVYAADLDSKRFGLSFRKLYTVPTQTNPGER